MPRPKTRSIGLSRRAGEFVLRLLELNDPVIGGSNLATIDPLLRRELLACGALLEGPTVCSITDYVDDGSRHIDLEWLPERAAYGYFTAGGYVFPDQALLRTYRVGVAWWLAWLVGHLTLVNAAKPFVLVENRAWDIGELWVTDRSKVPVIFARRLKTVRDVSALQNAMVNRTGRTGGIILGSGRAPATAWPLQYTFQPLAAMLLNEAQSFSLDENLLKGPYGGGKRAQKLPDIHLSHDDRTLTVMGEAMYFTGKEQQRILRKLVTAYAEGERHRSSDVLGSGGDTFAKKFKDNRYLTKLKTIVRQRGGYCWIEL